MKKLLFLFFTIAAVYSVNAQILAPQPSPFSKIEQRVGLTDVTLEYSRPSMRGRVIFGDLVPYDKIWRTGANLRTKITFTTDVVVSGQTLKAGTYAIFTKPEAEKWQVYFYTDYAGGGTPQTWDEAKVAAKVLVDVYELPMSIETFTMSFDNLSSDSAVLGLFWENTYVGLPFEVPTDSMVTESISKAMNGPTANDYYAAAVYYSEAGKDIKQAQIWMDKAMSMVDKPAFWQLRQQSLIYAKAGNKKGAIETAKKSLLAAEEAGNADYVKMNKDSLKEWGAM